MIVIKSKHHTRKYCYGGSGIFDSIFKNVINKATSSAIAQKVVNAATKDNIKKAINKAATSAITHKVADAVVSGATTATQKAVEDKVTDILKRKAPPPPQSAPVTNKKLKIDVSNLINASGSGIVLD